MTKRAEQERVRRREERRQREEARLREREFRKDPAWKLVSGWGGVEDDLALRACTRREEERIRNQIHCHQMENMMKRVYQIPTLFERQSQVHLSRKAVKEVLDGKMAKEQPKDSKSGGKSRKLSVKLQSKGVNSISPTPREEEEVKEEEDSDEYYESDPEDDKTCHHSLGEDVEEGTGLEDEIKDEVVEDGKEDARDSSPTHESQKLLDLPEENEGSDGKNEVGDVD
ncbi:golgin subfamily A member 6-like protein 22 isoform X4 [Ischnura elegans]|uniref:golgin subfamily A member 6-like protein 22 isoform X4 n=1 Tax=Ischnura elegans TaxID=197161 RepID=UPI001ED892E8|nr:golgin subfamily A member 6-like protein 22 isoform X4 [Ischnura elegans]